MDEFLRVAEDLAAHVRQALARGALPLGGKVAEPARFALNRRVPVDAAVRRVFRRPGEEEDVFVAEFVQEHVPDLGKAGAGGDALERERMHARAGSGGDTGAAHGASVAARRVCTGTPCAVRKRSRSAPARAMEAWR